MSEETRKLSAFEAFAQIQQTNAEAEEKAKQEAGSPKVERFRIGEDGEYSIRILPLAPNFDENGNILPMERKGYEYAVHQFFLTIKAPAKKGGKTKKLSIPVIRTTDKEVGFSVDLIDTYLKIAKEMYSQYKDLDSAKMRLWKELREDGEQETCPISSFTGAYPVKIIRSNNNGKTEYTVEIGRKTLNIKEEEAEKLLELPRIPEQLYRYTRYQFEATLVFLQQYDEEHDMEVCKEPDFIEAVEKLKGELPADDNSHFDLSGAASKDSSKEETTIDSLWAEYDVIVDQDLNEKSDEYQELREKIRQFIEDNGIDVRISRSKNNQQLLEEIDEALDEKAKDKPKEEKKEETVVQPSRRAPKPKVEEPEDKPENVDDNDGDGKTEEEKVDETPRRRRARPGREENEEAPAEKTEDETSESTIEEEAPRRRLHSRRLR